MDTFSVFKYFYSMYASYVKRNVGYFGSQIVINASIDEW